MHCRGFFARGIVRVNNAPKKLGDFTTTVQVIPISLMAVAIGGIASLVAWFLLNLINFFTDVFYYGRFTMAAASPAANHLGVFAVAMPVLGGLIVGLMARFGSDKIRGHGIPEAVESILTNGSRVPPKLAILKPLSAAISIGSGGPFGAEGPIIMTGGAFGSLIAQFFHLTSAERKTLLVAGAAAGMSAVFATPVAGVLLAVELLLFEWKPRSAIPVALASATAATARGYLLGYGPLFPVPSHTAFIGPFGLLGCVFAGLAAGLLGYVLTNGVYAAEDLFHKLPMHWMWWPAIGGVFVGIGGLIFPHALGVGYDTIGLLLKGDVPMQILLGVLLVKSAIWIISLGSGTSGGVVAPLLMTGAALGGVEALFLPHFGQGFWALASMGATLAATMGCPFTGAIFAIELTHDFNMLLPLLVTCFVAYAFAVLTLKRSILTEKIARRGLHLSREYATDPLETMFVREVMQTDPVVLPANACAAEALKKVTSVRQSGRGQNLFPIVDSKKRIVGVISRHDLSDLVTDPVGKTQTTLGQIATQIPVIAFADEPLRVVVYRMAETGFKRLPVVNAPDGRTIIGMISLDDLPRARRRFLQEERTRERVLRLGVPFRQRRFRPSPEPDDTVVEMPPENEPVTK